MYIGNRNFADVPSMSKYINCDAVFTTDKITVFVSDFPYSEIVKLILYLNVVSVPDIMYAVDVQTRHLNRPSYLSCEAACSILNYLLHYMLIW